MHAQTPQHLGQSPHRNRRLLQPAKHRRLGKSLGGHTPLTLDEARFSAQGLRLWAKEVTQTLTDLCYLVHSSSFFPSPNTELCWFHDVRWNCSLSSFLKLMCMGARFIAPGAGRLHHHPKGWRAFSRFSRYPSPKFQPAANV